MTRRPGEPELFVTGDVIAPAVYFLVEQVSDALASRGRADVVLAGGTTPRAVYARLAEAELDWPRVHLWLGDERFVAADHPDANVRMAREAFAPAITAGATVHPMDTTNPDRTAAAAAYAVELPSLLDVVILGVGEDGHTASLFPGQAALSEQIRRVVAIEGAPKPPPERLTITPPVIGGARRVLVLAAGAGKADAVGRALLEAREPGKTPIQLARIAQAMWIIDSAAAAHVTAPKVDA